MPRKPLLCIGGTANLQEVYYEGERIELKVKKDLSLCCYEKGATISKEPDERHVYLCKKFQHQDHIDRFYLYEHVTEDELIYTILKFSLKQRF